VRVFARDLFLVAAEVFEWSSKLERTESFGVMKRLLGWRNGSPLRFQAMSQENLFPSAPGHLLDVLRVPCPLHCYLGGGSFDLTKIVGVKFDRDRSYVFVEAMQFGRTRDRNNPRLLRQQPGERNLGWSRLLSLCDLAQQFNQGLICFHCLRRKARKG